MEFSRPEYCSGSLSLLQDIFPTQGSNPGLLHCRQILHLLSHKGSPRILAWVAHPLSSGPSWPRNQTRVSCIAGAFFTNWAIRDAQRALLTARSTPPLPRCHCCSPCAVLCLCLWSPDPCPQLTAPGTAGWQLTPLLAILASWSPQLLQPEQEEMAAWARCYQ